MLTATRHNQREVRFHNASQHARWDNGRYGFAARAASLRPQPAARSSRSGITIARLAATAALIGACVAPWLYLIAFMGD